MIPTMKIITLEEFLSQAIDAPKITQKIYNSKILIKGPIFSLGNEESAVKYADKYPQGLLCLLVKTKYYFQVWQEEQKEQAGIGEEENRKTIADTYTDTSSDSADDPLQSKYTKELVKVAKNLLSEYIGPIAGVICKKILSKHPDLTARELINTLAKRINSPEKSLEFKNILERFVREHY